MLKNYLRIAFRSLLRNRFSAAINIGGLAIGMAVALLIGLWIQDELSFDKYHEHYDRIVQVRLTGACQGCASAIVTLSMRVESTLKAAVPEIRFIEAVP